MDSVTRIAQEMVMNNGQPLKAIASKIGKPYPTLLRELNPYDKGAKLGAETLLDLMRVTRDYRPLQYMAESLGMKIMPQREATNGKGRALALGFTESFLHEVERSEADNVSQAG